MPKDLKKLFAAATKQFNAQVNKIKKEQKKILADLRKQIDNEKIKKIQAKISNQ